MTAIKSYSPDVTLVPVTLEIRAKIRVKRVKRVKSKKENKKNKFTNKTFRIKANLHLFISIYIISH